MESKFLFFVFFLFRVFLQAQEVDVQFGQEGILFLEGQDSILFYQIKEKDLNGAYKRCHYVHPLYGLKGEILTEDFPEDHPHHRGVFWAWHQLYVGDKKMGDGWEIDDFRWSVDSVVVVDSSQDYKSLCLYVSWYSDLWKDEEGSELLLVSEKTLLTVYPKEKNHRKIDLDISLLAVEKDMEIGGSENEKGYGGFSVRLRMEEGMTFRSKDGIVIPQNLPLLEGQWMDISGPIGKDGQTAGISIFCHPDNPQPSNAWILRDKISMQNAVFPYPGAEAIPLSSTQSTKLKYRLLIHSNPQQLDLGHLFQQYIK